MVFKTREVSLTCKIKLWSINFLIRSVEEIVSYDAQDFYRKFKESKIHLAIFRDLLCPGFAALEYDWILIVYSLSYGDNWNIQSWWKIVNFKINFWFYETAEVFHVLKKLKKNITNISFTVKEM